EGALPPLADLDELNRVEALSLCPVPSGYGPVGQMGTLLRSPHLSRLRRLWAHAGNLSGEQTADLLSLPARARVEATGWECPTQETTRAYLRALTHGDFPRLGDLDLPWLFSLTAEMEELVNSALWPRLHTLALRDPAAVPWPAVMRHGRLRRLRG